MSSPSAMVPAYLERLGVEPAVSSPDLGLLAELQAAHLVAVPFENLDVFHRRGVSTSLGHSLPKIVERGRGGWCFELNGAFGWLLSELGFEVDYVSCRVHGDEGWGPPLDHCALVVHLEAGNWFVDVGFGDNCMIPVPLVAGEHPGVPRRVRVELEDDEFVVSERQLDAAWAPQLWGRIDPLPLEAFEPRSHFLQTEPRLPWTEQPFATAATSTDGSRVTLRPGVIRRRAGTGEFDDEPVDDHAWPSLLGQHFGLDDTLVPSD